MYWRILSPTLLSPFVPWARAIPTNRTIDDSFGDLITGVKPIYMPGPWQGASCAGCAIHPPIADAFGRTYSASTYWAATSPENSIQFSFQGTAVYVYFILVNFVATGVTTETWVNFTLDGQFSGTFYHPSSNSTDFEFNSLVYSKDGLPNINHTLVIYTAGVNDSFASFDYANYTFDDTPATSSSSLISSSIVTSTQSISGTSRPIPGTSSSVPVAAIVGGTIGGFIIILVAILIYMCLHRRRSVDGSLKSEVTTFPVDEPSPEAPSQGPSSLPPSLEAFVSRKRFQNSPLPNNDSLISRGSREQSRYDSVRRMRQAEIDEQIQRLTREIQALAEQQGAVNEHLSIPLLHRPRRERGVLHLEEQVEAMRGEIEYLHAQLHSDWAHGLSNNPPPSYSVGIPPSENER